MRLLLTTTSTGANTLRKCFVTVTTTMARETTSIATSASTNVMLRTESKTSARRTTLTMTTSKRRKRNSTLLIGLNANKLNSRMTKNVAWKRKKKLNTSRDRTALNKVELSTLDFSLMTPALLLLTNSEELPPTANSPAKRFPTRPKALFTWTAFLAKNPPTSTTTETTTKMKMLLSKCVSKSTLPQESANLLLKPLVTSTRPTRPPATTLPESRSSARMVLSHKWDPRPTRLLLSSLASSWLPLFFWLHTSTT
mmetsp:Transcript_67826/g.102291  ORF Transcript_67826/g.102291 Transcript_67826/m.102291 type:complete len:254 (-) Transcript_67826:204-965(-)